MEQSTKILILFHESFDTFWEEETDLKVKGNKKRSFLQHKCREKIEHGAYLLKIKYALRVPVVLWILFVITI